NVQTLVRVSPAGTHDGSPRSPPEPADRARSRAPRSGRSARARPRRRCGELPGGELLCRLPQERYSTLPSVSLVSEVEVAVLSSVRRLLGSVAIDSGGLVACGSLSARCSGRPYALHPA